MSDSTTHPQAIEAQQRAKERANRREAAKVIVKAAQAQGVHFVDIHPLDYSEPYPYKPSKEGRMTIAYRVDRRNVIAVSTALCHTGDDFDKLEGRARAAVNMSAGHTILMRAPNPRFKSVKNFLLEAFTVHKHRVM